MSQIQPKSIFRKIVQFPITRIVLGLVFIALFSAAANFGTAAIAALLKIPTAAATQISVAASVLLVCLGYALFVRLVERRPVAELALRRLPELLLGTLFGLALFSLVVLGLWLVGSYQVLGTNPWQIMFSALWIGIVPGFVEEIIFRGLFHRIIEESLGTWIALIAVSLFFGFAHIANPGATLFSSAAIALEAGLMLGMAYTLTKRLWVPIGIHFAWNFAQGGIYGIKVSGLDVDGWLRSQLVGPTLISGGDFGAEGSIVAVGICLLAFGLLLILAVRRGRWVQPFWVRRKTHIATAS